MRIAIVTLALIGAGLAAADGPQTLSFEAASVKLSPPLDFASFRSGQRPRMGVKMDAGRIDIAQTSLFDVIAGAYRLKPYQLSGPDWMKTITLDIVAKLPAGATEGQIPEMLQTLLAERFGLKIHHENKDQPVYALIQGKGGPKLKEAVPDTEAPVAAVDPKAPDFGMMSRMGNSTMTGDPTKGMVITGMTQRGTMRVSFGGSGIHIESSSLSMAALAEDLTQYMDRPVVDKTGIKGDYQVALDASMEDMRNFMSKQGFPGGMPPGGGDFGGGRGGPNPFAGDGSEPSGSSILVSIQKLGLKLDPQKAPMEAVVVDHVERTPIEN